MVKPKKSKRPSLAADLNASVSQQAVSNLQSGIFSPAQNYFAYLTPSVPKAALRIYNTISGQVICNHYIQQKDIVDASGSTAGRLRWGSIPASVIQAAVGQGTTPTKKRRRQSQQSSDQVQVVAVGLADGGVALYDPTLSPTPQILELKGQHTDKVTDIAFLPSQNGASIVTASQDGTLVSWTIDADGSISSKQHNLPGTFANRILANPSKPSEIICANQEIYSYDLASEHVVQKFVGHINQVVDLAWIGMDHFASVAENERNASIWKTGPKSKSTQAAIAEFSSIADLQSISAGVEPTSHQVIAISASGQALIYSFDDATSQKSSGLVSIKARSTVQVISKGSNNSCINAAISLDAATLMTAWTPEGFQFNFEKLNVTDERGNTLTEVNVERTMQVAADASASSRVLYDDSKSVVRSTVDYDELVNGDSEAAFSERVKSLSVNDEKVITAGIEGGSTISHARLLLQALQTNDKVLLESSLKEKDIKVVQTTIRRLPARYVVLLLEKLLERFTQKPARGRELVPWIKQILALHTAYLLTVPDLVQRLSHLYAALNSRLATHDKLMSLHGRLDLVLSQIEFQDQLSIGQSDGRKRDDTVTYYDEEASNDEEEDNLVAAQVQNMDIMNSSDEEEEEEDDDEDMMDVNDLIDDEAEEDEDEESDEGSEDEDESGSDDEEPATNGVNKHDGAEASSSEEDDDDEAEDGDDDDEEEAEEGQEEDDDEDEEDSDDE